MKYYETLTSKIVAKNPWFQVRQDDIRLPNGEDGVYNVINIGDAVWVVPILSDRRVVLIHQYRYPINGWCMEIPAGSIKPGYTPRDTAIEELREEVGGTTDELIFLGNYWTMKGIGDEQGHFFLAKNVTLGEMHHEATEIIERKIVPFEQALAMARNGQLNDAPSALAILLSADFLS